MLMSWSDCETLMFKKNTKGTHTQSMFQSSMLQAPSPQRLTGQSSQTSIFLKYLLPSSRTCLQRHPDACSSHLLRVQGRVQSLWILCTQSFSASTTKKSRLSKNFLLGNSKAPLNNIHCLSFSNWQLQLYDPSASSSSKLTHE
jgi:hypothetical protein